MGGVPFTVWMRKSRAMEMCLRPNRRGGKERGEERRGEKN